MLVGLSFEIKSVYLKIACTGQIYSVLCDRFKVFNGTLVIKHIPNIKIATKDKFKIDIL